MSTTTSAIWYVVRGGGYERHVVEPGPHSIDVPDAILTWAEGHGLDPDDPDVYLLVTPADEAVGAIGGQIAHREHPMSATDMAALQDAFGE